MFILPTFYEQLVDMSFFIIRNFSVLKVCVVIYCVERKKFVEKSTQNYLWNGHRFQTLFFSYLLFSLLSLSVSKFWRRWLLYEMDKLSGKKTQSKKDW